MARIAAVAGACEVMGSGRLNKKAMFWEATAAELKRCADFHLISKQLKSSCYF